MPAARRTRPARGSPLDSFAPLLRLRHLPVAVLADAAQGVLAGLHRRPRQRLLRDRRVKARLFLRKVQDLAELGAEVEVLDLAALGAQVLTVPLAGFRIADHDAVVLVGLVLRNEALGDVRLDLLDRPLERILPAPAAGGAVDEHVAGLDLDLVAFRGQAL